MDSVLYLRFTFKKGIMEIVDSEGKTWGLGMGHRTGQKTDIVPVSICLGEEKYVGDLTLGLPGGPWQGRLRGQTNVDCYDVRIIPGGGGIAKWGRWTENSFINVEARSADGVEWAVGRITQISEQRWHEPVPYTVGKIETSTGSCFVLEGEATSRILPELLFHRRMRLGRYCSEGDNIEKTCMIAMISHYILMTCKQG